MAKVAIILWVLLLFGFRHGNRLLYSCVSKEEAEKFFNPTANNYSVTSAFLEKLRNEIICPCLTADPKDRPDIAELKKRWNNIYKNIKKVSSINIESSKVLKNILYTGFKYNANFATQSVVIKNLRSNIGQR